MRNSQSTPSSRRVFLHQVAALGALAAGGQTLAACGRDGSAGPLGQQARGAQLATETVAGRLLPGAVDGRVLVLIDLQGGNDGLSMVVPASDPNYYDLRPTLALPENDVLELDDRVGLHPNLTRLHQRGVATVEGIGPIDGDLSHFAMTERWERGDVTGSKALRTGFLGRLADALDDGSPLVGVSLAGPTPHFTNQNAATLSLNGRNDLWFLNNNDWSETATFQDGLRDLSANREGSAATMARSYEQLLGLAAQMPDDEDDIDWDQSMLSDGGNLGQQLYLAADLLEANLGVRVVYATIGGFDTHDNHAWQHPQLMSELDAAVDGFLDRMDGAGMDDRVLVATASEFGRRVQENGEGLDHGSASAMLVAGPVSNERFGEPPSLVQLDDDDNLRVTAGFDRYLASLAEDWLGIEAASVLPDSPEPLGLLA